MQSVNNTMPPHDTAEASPENGLSELDHALAHWARRHGADPLVARAFALASQAVSEGHTCLALDRIPATLMSAANQRQLRDALEASDLVGSPGEIRPLILEENRLYLQRYHDYETRLVANLERLMAAEPGRVDNSRLMPGHGLFENGGDDMEGTNWQAVAAFIALRHRFSVISGGPGTGKTHTIVRLLRVLIELALASGERPPLVALAAPTGKAAARMIESVRNGLDAMTADPAFDASTIEAHIPPNAHTLHRLLGLTKATKQPRFNAENPLPHDVIIVDEASMVDLPMMAKLLGATASTARLILLGDRYQLASVESGAVLAEICASAGVNGFTMEQQSACGELLAKPLNPVDSPLADHVVTLKTSRRFNVDSAIGKLAAAVNSGDIRATQALLAGDSEDLDYLDRSDATAMDHLMNRLADEYALLCETSDPGTALAQIHRQVVLTAIRQGPCGNETINAGVTERLARRFDFNPHDPWYNGRPVMITQNDYRIDLFNGDIGVALTNADGQLRIWFEGEQGLRAFLPSALPAHDTVYAMTIHKSQGSEFDSVTVVLPDYSIPVLTRELLYTALTRARNKLVIQASPDSLARSVANCTRRVNGFKFRKVPDS